MKPAKATKRIQLPQPVISGVGKPHLPISSEEITEIKKRSNEPLLFSFKFFDRNHEALVQAAPCTVIRDNNRDNRLDFEGCRGDRIYLANINLWLEYPMSSEAL
jgi:hypothetical protein